MTPAEKIAYLEKTNHALRRELGRMEKRFAELQGLSKSQAVALEGKK